MTDAKEQRIYCAEQIYVPENFQSILKHYSKAVIKEQPENIIDYSLKYFEKQFKKNNNKEEEDNTKFDEYYKPDSTQINKNN